MVSEIWVIIPENMWFVFLVLGWKSRGRYRPEEWTGICGKIYRIGYTGKFIGWGMREFI